MKTANAILQHINRQIEGAGGEIADRMDMSDTRRALLTTELKLLTDLRDWITAPGKFDADAFTKEGE